MHDQTSQRRRLKLIVWPLPISAVDKIKSEVDNLNKCKNHHNEKKNVEPTLLRFYIFQLTTPSTLTARLSVPEAEKQP